MEQIVLNLTWLVGLTCLVSFISDPGGRLDAEQQLDLRLDIRIDSMRACLPVDHNDDVYFERIELHMIYTSIGTGPVMFDVGSNSLHAGDVRVAADEVSLRRGRIEYGLNVADALLVGPPASGAPRKVRLMPNESIQVAGSVIVPVRRKGIAAIPATIGPGGHVVQIGSLLATDHGRVEVRATPVVVRIPYDPRFEICEGF